MQRFPTALRCATALLLGAVACSDDDAPSSSDEPSTTTAPKDGPTTLAEGENVELVGSGLGSQTLNITAEESNGEVTGEFRLNEVVVRVDCADTDTEGIVIVGGEDTTGAPDAIAEGDLLALIIEEGEPDRVALYANDSGAATCTEMLESVPGDLLTNADNFNDVATGSDIQTG
jgi:hypothetical protein